MFARHRRSQLMIMVAVLIMTVAITGCQSSPSARDQAADLVHRQVDNTVASLEDQVRVPAPISGEDLLNQLDLPAGPDVIIFEREARPDGTLLIKIAHHARGESGGGLGYQSYVVRLCAAYALDPAGEPRVTVTDTPCASSLPASTGNAGTVDETIPFTP